MTSPEVRAQIRRYFYASPLVSAFSPAVLPIKGRNERRKNTRGPCLLRMSLDEGKGGTRFSRGKRTDPLRTNRR